MGNTQRTPKEEVEEALSKIKGNSGRSYTILRRDPVYGHYPGMTLPVIPTEYYQAARDLGAYMLRIECSLPIDGSDPIPVIVWVVSKGPDLPENAEDYICKGLKDDGTIKLERQ